ncbi:nucleotidyltransferase family protein [soil metagenome]
MNLPPVIVLCGGLGTRLREVVADRPKSLAAIGRAPFLQVLLEHLQNQGVTGVVLAAGHLGEQLRSFAHDHPSGDMTISIVEELEPLGTGGAVRFAVESARLSGPILVINGDTLFSGSLSELYIEHRDRQAKVSLALVPPLDEGRFGAVAVDSDGWITSFSEKEGGSIWTSAGAYVFEEEVLRAISGGRSSLEYDLFPSMVGRRLAGVTFPHATFLDIGTPESLAQAEQFKLNHLNS